MGLEDAQALGVQGLKSRSLRLDLIALSKRFRVWGWPGPVPLELLGLGQGTSLKRINPTKCPKPENPQSSPQTPDSQVQKALTP